MRIEKKHFYMLIETSNSSKINPIRYFVDNFEIISEKLFFEDYVEKWTVDNDWDIIMETSSFNKYYIEVWKSNKIILWDKKTSDKKSFLFTRFFEDTDSEYIVWKNDDWYFIISRNKFSITKEDQAIIEYFDEFIFFNRQNKLFVMINKMWEIVFLDIYWVLLLTTDLSKKDKINEINFSVFDNKIISVKLEWESNYRKYII